MIYGYCRQNRNKCLRDYYNFNRSSCENRKEQHAIEKNPLLIYSIYRIGNKDNIFTITPKNNNLAHQSIKLFLPDKRDYIQQRIIVIKNFYEDDILRAMETYIDQNSVVIDIGSNIGNHVLSVEYPASLLRGWKTSPRTVNNNTIYQFRFRFVNFCSN